MLQTYRKEYDERTVYVLFEVKPFLNDIGGAIRQCKRMDEALFNYLYKLNYGKSGTDVSGHKEGWFRRHFGIDLHIVCEPTHENFDIVYDNLEYIESSNINVFSINEDGDLFSINELIKERGETEE